MGVPSEVVEEVANRRVRRERIGWLIAAAWLGGAAGALGYFGFQDQRAFEPVSVTRFDAEMRAQAAEGWFSAQRATQDGTPRVTVVTVTRPQCSCNRYTAPHVAKLSERYSSEGVRFLEVEPPAELPWVSAAPAAMVFDAHGALAYFGPYSSSAWCGSDGGLVEPVLDGLLDGDHLQPQPFYGTGCFCDGVST